MRPPARRDDRECLGPELTPQRGSRAGGPELTPQRGSRAGGPEFSQTFHLAIGFGRAVSRGTTVSGSTIRYLGTTAATSPEGSTATPIT